MKNDDNDIWSGLKTVSSFDNGDSSSKNDSNGAMAMGVTGDLKELQHFSPSSLLVESLIDQLCKMIEKDPLDQKTLYLMICEKLHRMKLIDTSYHMEEFEFMRSHYQRALYNLLSVAKANHRFAKISRGDGNDTHSSPSTASASAFMTSMYPNNNLKLDLELLSSPSETFLEWSRYANEFVELEFIARGGFGQVYKARHKLDDTIYAVKKIHLRYQNASGFLRSLKEVKMLACLNHPNIVAYKAAWLEPFDNRSVKQNRVATVMFKDNTDSPIGETGIESSDIIFENSKSVDDKPNGSKDSILITSDSSSSHASNLAVCKYKVNGNRMFAFNFMPPSLKQDWATLFVQMQLCEENMKEWLDRRNRSTSSQLSGDVSVDIDQCLSVFVRILKGIEYIHDKGIVHHDIKPSNIFVSRDLRQVQVGDFGLACCLLTHTAVPLVQKTSHHEGQIGTKLYAAPEQIKGVCSPKSDIYSCGIILLELIQPFQTEMERSKIISLLKRGQIPTDLTAKWPHLVKIISETVSTSVTKRPLASQLLEVIRNINHHCKVSAQMVNSVINEKDKLIFQLKEEIAVKDKEIERLRQRLSEFNVV